MTPAETTSWAGAALFAVLLFIANRRITRSKGRNLWFHLLFGVFVFLVLKYVPAAVQFNLFSPLGVVVVGTVYPIYESIRAVCTPGTQDDTQWLQFWLAQGTLSYCTEWVDDVATRVPSVREHWYEFEFFYMLWLFLPFTDGAVLTYDFFTKPFLAPIIRPVSTKMGGWYTTAVQTIISATHLWILWIAFVLLNPKLKRFIVVSIGTVYPLCASLVAVTTPEGEDDTFWLTYWSCFGVLFLIMDVLETYLGKIPGFYSLALFGIVYLMLPLFRGAEQIFRKILVPIAGMQKTLLMRDAAMMKKDIKAQIPRENRKEFLMTVTQILAEPDSDDEDDNKDDDKDSKPKPNADGYQSINQTEVV